MLRLLTVFLAMVLCSFVPAHNNNSTAFLPNPSHICHHHHDCQQDPNGLWSFFADRNGTAAEIADAKSKVEAHRTANTLTSNTQRGKNIGFVEGSITNGGVTRNFTLTNTVTISNSGLSPDPNIFTATVVNGYLRVTDSEYQMLSLLAKNSFSAVRGSVFSAATGTIKVASERAYCASCSDVIKVQFKQMFPNVNLVFVSGWVV
jgi:The  BURPS668_1122 family of deaminases